MAINEWPSAIESYDFVIKHWPETEAALAAVNNKAVCLLSLNRIDEAIQLLEPLRDHGELQLYALPNLARCYAKKRQGDKALQAVDKLCCLIGGTEQITNLRTEIERLLNANE
jgi:tetratricopeptide (TPR) repeat protein